MVVPGDRKHDVARASIDIAECNGHRPVPRLRRVDRGTIGQLYVRRTLRSVAIGAPVGAVLFVAAVWVIDLVGSGHPSALIYVGAAVIGAAVGPVLLPFVTLARADGTDAHIVAARTPSDGHADTPIEGAQKADREQSAG